MMRVWIVQDADYESTYVHGVYSSLEKAEEVKADLDAVAIAMAERIVKRQQQAEGKEGIPPIDDWRDHYMVTEYVVDEPPI